MPTHVRVPFAFRLHLFVVLGFCSVPALVPHLFAAAAAPVAPQIATAAVPAAPPAPPQFLEPTAIDFRAIIPPPPAEDSIADRADLQTVLNLQVDRTPAQIARAERVAKQTIFSFASPVLGPWFTTENLPESTAFFKIITAESYAVATLAKIHFNRLRPMLKDSQVQATTGRMRSTSYPSGHSSDAATWAALLTEIFPGYHEAFLAQVRETMWGRVLAGAHYPTDTQAGQILGDAIGREMLNNPKVRAGLAAVRAECEAFLGGKNPAPPAISANDLPAPSAPAKM